MISKNGWKFLALCVCSVILLLLFGCSGKVVMITFDQQADNGASNSLVIKADGSKFTTETTQESEGALGYNGGVGAAGEQIKELAGKFSPDLSQKDSNNPTTTTTTTSGTVEEGVNVKPVEKDTPTNEGSDPVKDSDEVTSGEETSDTSIEGYNFSASYTAYGQRNGGRWAWRIPRKGPDFGPKALFVFSDGKKFLVNNTSKNCRDREDTCSRDKSSDMYGFVFKPGIGPNGDGDSDTGTSHGGVYLHAPYKGAQKVTVYYNK